MGSEIVLDALGPNKKVDPRLISVLEKSARALPLSPSGKKDIVRIMYEKVTGINQKRGRGKNARSKRK